MLRQIPFYLAVLAGTFLVRNHPFFWDTVQLASKHAHFYYDTNFQSLLLPEVIDSGHPPAFGMYLAAMWKLFGKTLTVSHFAMFPFLLGLVFFLFKTGEKIAGKRQAPWLVLLCFSDPVLAGQSVLVSPDVPLACFFLMGLWAVWEQKKGWLVLAVIGLGLISMRGMMIGVALYLFSWLMSEKLDFKNAIQKVLPFLPGGIVSAGFLFYHWQQTGWIGYHENSVWAPSFERVDLQGFIKNVAVLGWRMLDFGRVFVWVALAGVAFILLKNKRWKLPRFNCHHIGWQLVMLFFVLFIALVPSQLLHKGLLAHRYLLPVFLSLNFLTFYLLSISFPKEQHESPAAFPKFFYLLAVAGLLTGNLWVYPKKISQGWDSTLAHLPWYSLQQQAQDFIQNAAIPYNKVGTAFPNIGPRENVELNGVGEGFIPKDLAANCYILYSNIMNDFADEEIDELERRWPEVFRQERRGVSIILYKNPDKECEN